MHEASSTLSELATICVPDFFFEIRQMNQSQLFFFQTMEGPAVPSFFVDPSYYYDACRDPRSPFYKMCPPCIVAKIDETTDIEELKMKVSLHNLVQCGILDVSASAESAVRKNA